MNTARQRLIGIVILMAMIVCAPNPAWAARRSVELGVLPSPLGSAPAAVVPGQSYVNIELINIVNHPKAAWFTTGESNYVVAFEFEPVGPDKKPKECLNKS